MRKLRWILAATALLAGCYKTPKPNCTFSCDQTATCPTDYTCEADGICHLVQNGAPLACEQPFADAPQPDGPKADARKVDAGPADAKPIDGKPADARPVDAHVDARPIDAHVDAHVDATVDAHVDATVDANLCPALTVASDGSTSQQLVISLIQPVNPGKIELYNNTASDIDLATSTYQLEVPGQGTLVLSTTAVIVKAHGYNTVTWPTSFTDETSGGELVLYGSAGRTAGDIVDFVCWDADGNGMTVKPTAQTAGKWSTGTPACAGVITSTSPAEITRKNNTTGTLGSDYDPAATRAPLSCP